MTALAPKADFDLRSCDVADVPIADIASRVRSPRLHKRTRAYSGNLAFRRPLMYSFMFDDQPRVDIVKAGSTSSERTAAARCGQIRSRLVQTEELPVVESVEALGLVS